MQILCVQLCNFSLLNLRFVAALPALLAKFYKSCGAKIKFTATPYPSATRRKDRDRYKIFREPSRRRETKFARSFLKRFAMKF
ncbi:hypothetical protein CAMGR0001_2484 [Campylobacter gracilis RM3268]|uniref:Secreted protein n=1 Tax=Campylobacter gracilis RM3268 TaxID=553220 RepID=C8PFD1_9BACT|nr:hypothetical protein CAMGR0001_2484 [Campylobacter gracilis RM3268]